MFKFVRGKTKAWLLALGTAVAVLPLYGCPSGGSAIPLSSSALSIFSSPSPSPSPAPAPSSISYPSNISQTTIAAVSDALATNGTANGASSIVYSISPSLTGTGLSINASTGTISGTPTASCSNNGGNGYTVTATNSHGSSSTNISITITLTPYYDSPSALISSLNDPQAVAVDSNGMIYVAETGTGSVKIFNSAGTLVATIPGIAGVNGVQVDSMGNIYASTGQNGTILEYGGGGHLSVTVTPGDEVTGFAVQGPGTLFVGDTSWGSILNAYSGGVRITSADIFLPLNNYPQGAAMTPNGNVLVITNPPGSVLEVSLSGTVLHTWTGFTGGPTGITVDSNGNFYVASSTSGKVQQFNSGGTLLNTWTVAGAQSVAADSSGNLYVVGTGSSVQKITYHIGAS